MFATKLSAIFTPFSKNDKSVAKFSDYKKAMLLKLANTVLPRLNEHTGEDGGPIKQDITGILTKVYGDK